MSNIFKNINKVCKDKKVSHAGFRVFMVLVSYNSCKKIYPSLETISKDCGIKSISFVSRLLNLLKERGYIEIHRRKHQSNIYKIVDVKEEVKQSHPKTEQEPAKTEPTKTEEPKKYSIDKELTKNFISQIAYVIAEYRNEPEPKPQVYTFINNVINLNPEPMKYKIAFMLLIYVLKYKDKFCGELPYSYFKSFFGIKIYSDFRKSIFDTKQNSSIIPNSNNIPFTKVKIKS